MVVLAAVAWLGTVTGARATYPGSAGRISYTQQTAFTPPQGATIFGTEIRTIDGPDGANNQPLTNWPASATFQNPRWSPGGTRLASWEGLGTGPSVFLTILDATGDRIEIADLSLLLTLGNRFVGNAGPTWSPGGTKLAIALGTAGGGVYVVDVDTKMQTQVLTNPSNDLIYDQPAWSPDGQRIAVRIHQSFVGIYGHRDDIGVFPAAGGAVTNLTQNHDPAGYPDDFGCFLSDPNWAPDASRIVYVTGQCDHPPIANEFGGTLYSPAYQLATVDLVGGLPALLVPARMRSGFFELPVYSPDGLTVATIDHFDVRQIWFFSTSGVGESYITLPPLQGSMQVSGAGGIDWQPLAKAVRGKVTYRGGRPAAGITVSLTGTDDDAVPVTRTTQTDAQGKFSFTIQTGTYTVAASGDPPDENGGVASAAAAIGGRCVGTATENRCAVGHVISADVTFIYTQCAKPERHPNGKPPTNCPIIFLPGFLGTRIECTEAGAVRELWPNVPPGPYFDKMTLLPDGVTNTPDDTGCSTTAYAVEGTVGMVETVAGTPVYQTTFDFLERIAPTWVAYAYDWRRPPPLAVPALDALIDVRLKASGASRVVLMAHSMGGLVTRAYLEDDARAEKVSRVVTLGTPYWGAPKTHFALLEGDTDAPGSKWIDLDVFTSAGALQTFAQHASGAFWLYPSAQLGPWLSLRGAVQDPVGVDRWIASLGAAPGLLDAAQDGHALLDGFKTGGADYEVVVGAGTPTVKAVNIRHDLKSVGRGVVIGEWADLTFASGDGTVPATSATQGAFDNRPPIRDQVPIHYACGVSHVALPGDGGVDARIERFLIDGTAIEGPEADCGYSGTEIRTYQIDLLQDTARVLVGGRSLQRRAAESLTVSEAASRGLVNLQTIGDRTTIVTDGRQPVALAFGGRHQAVQVHTISSTSGDGTWHSYAGGTTPIAIGADGAVTHDGKPVKEFRLKSALPRTKARVKQRRGTYLVQLRARAANGFSATYYQIGTQAVMIYKTPLRLNASDFASLTFASADAFGNLEAWHGPRKPRSRHDL